METYVPQNEKESRMPGGKSEALSLSEILQARRVGGVGWSAPLELKRGCRGWISSSESSNGGDGEGRTVVQAGREEAGSMERGDFIHGGKTGTSGLVKVGMLPCQCKMVGGNGVVQMKQLIVGKDILNSKDIAVKVKVGDGICLPQLVDRPTTTEWECVNRAMIWGCSAKEGIAGWFDREFSPRDFNGIIRAVDRAVRKLNGPLDNDNNKTLIAIRAFRSADGSMADGTLMELKEVLDIMENVRKDLLRISYIEKKDKLLSIEAELGEAHPNTLPTAKVCFGKKTFYFKGRGGNVESALVGALDSSALRIPQAVPGKYPVGIHRFATDGRTHLAEEVKGGEDQVGEVREKEVPGERKQRVVCAWMSAIKTAVLASVTGSNDMHEHNVKWNVSDVIHLIDGEFLLDVTLWDEYAQAISEGSFQNINKVMGLAREHLESLMGGLADVEVAEVRAEVVKEFENMNLGGRQVLVQILEPVRRLIEQEAFLRVMPFGTDYWLTELTKYNNNPGNYSFEEGWEGIKGGFNGSILVHEDMKLMVSGRLQDNYRKGMVPVFHVGAASGNLYMNKYLVIGHVKEGRSVVDFLEYLKTEFAKAVNDGRIVGMIGAIFDNYAPKPRPVPMGDSSVALPPGSIPNPNLRSELETTKGLSETMGGGNDDSETSSSS